MVKESYEMKFLELAVVRVLKDFPNEGISKGEMGTVVLTFSVPYEAYEVEFCYSDGRTKALFTINPLHLEEVTK